VLRLCQRNVPCAVKKVSSAVKGRIFKIILNDKMDFEVSYIVIFI
jgi:hypothetical protein